MSYKTIYLPEVLIDIQNAVEWYESQKKGLGIEFFKFLKKHQTLLITKPLSFSLRYDEVYCLKITKFPYMLHYKVEVSNKTVIVLALLHTSRNPIIWKTRNKTEE